MTASPARVFRSIAITVAVGLAGCAGDSGRYQSYPSHSSFDSNAPEACRALQSVIEARERYGIVAASREQDLEKLRRCGLPYHYGGGPTPSQASTSAVIPYAGVTAG